jgi:hypothetical protein
MRTTTRVTAAGLFLACCSAQETTHPHPHSGQKIAGSACLPSPTDTSPDLTPDPSECVAVQAHGVGVQIYSCQADGTFPAGSFAPEANLLDMYGNYIGNHFLGPTWQSADGSKIKAAVVQRDPAPDPVDDIPWLLLGVNFEDGPGAFAEIENIQRIHTSGGVAPAPGCNPGDQARVPYEADYLFWAPFDPSM